ncbi:zinc ribbon domain-containing protein [uncultured Bifidobacterium sp.]|uniref:zinc ribbon domain-containing protein n=1 Tax=uncultured Bifidobacterium sp. TaxID=165187 RepID=UPI00338E905F
MEYMMRYCTQCGTQLSEGAKFCMSCGQPVQQPEAAQPAAQPAVPTDPQPAPPASNETPASDGMPSWQQPPAPQQAPAWQAQPAPQAGYTPEGVASAPAAPSKKRSKGVVALAVIAVIAVIAAAAFGVWWFLLRGDDMNPAGRYSMSNGNQTFELVIEDDGAFKLTDAGGSGDYLAGVIGEGTADGDNVRYPLSDIKASTDNGEMTLADLIGQADSSGIGSAMADAIEVQVTAPKNAAHGNIVGTWGLSGSLLTFSAEIHITANADGTVEAGMTAFGEEPSNATGTWTDNGGGRYTVTFDNGSPLEVTLPQ